MLWIIYRNTKALNVHKQKRIFGFSLSFAICIYSLILLSTCRLTYRRLRTLFDRQLRSQVDKQLPIYINVIQFIFMRTHLYFNFILLYILSLVRQYLIVGIDKETELWLPNVLENNLTITCPSNTGHKFLSTELLAP